MPQNYHNKRRSEHSERYAARHASLSDNPLREAIAEENLISLQEQLEECPELYHLAVVHSAAKGNLAFIRYLVTKPELREKEGAGMEAVPPGYGQGKQEETEKEALDEAALAGHADVVKFLLINRPELKTNLNEALSNAVTGRHMNIVTFLVHCGAKNYNDAMAVAAKYNSTELVAYFLAQGLEDKEIALNNALVEAAASGHLDMSQYLIERGATDIKGALAAASQNDDEALSKWIQDYIQKQKALRPLSRRMSSPSLSGQQMRNSQRIKAEAGDNGCCMM